MIQLKLSDIVLTTDAGVILNPGIAAVLRAHKLPATAMSRLRRIGRKLTQEVQNFSEIRTDLIKELGEEVFEDYEEKDAEGKPQKKQRPTGGWRVKAENRTEFFAKEKELLEMDIQIDAATLKESELGDKYEGVSAADLMQCYAFILEG
jgi:hypothetical protein